MSSLSVQVAHWHLIGVVKPRIHEAGASSQYPAIQVKLCIHHLMPDASDAKMPRKCGKDNYHKWIMIDVFAKFSSHLCITCIGHRGGEWRA